MTKILLTSCHHEQIIYGSSMKILSPPIPKYLANGNSWIQKAWKSMTQHNITIQLSKIKIPKTAFPQDYPLMDAICPLIPQHHIPWVNKCRLYLHIYFIGDFTTNTGQSIISRPSKLRTPIVHRKFCPRIPQPNAREWSAWNKEIHKILLDDTYLIHPIGRKYNSPTKHRNDDQLRK